MDLSTYTIMAPAKINICLHVLGRRASGYHDLAMLMQRVSLYDQLELTCDHSGQVSVDCPGLDLNEGGENIAGRAARAMLNLAGSSAGVKIRIDKRIPAAAGLGGGSSDAAAVMLALNRLLGLDFTPAELTPHAVRLGADVPFFLLESAAWATGVGEVLEPVSDLPPVWYLLANPKVPVSTAWVFQNLGLTSPRQAAKLREFPRTTAELVRLFHNDLEAVTIGRYPVIDEMKEAMISCGAEGALMSGSGATVFGVFPDEDSVRAAETQLAQARGWLTFAVQPLP